VVNIKEGTMPDLARLAATSGLSPRKLRYTLDHHLLPGGDVSSRGRGVPRSFTGFEAFGLVVATVMLESGLKRALVRDSLARLCHGRGREVRSVPLYQAFMASGPSRLEVGDWRHVRLYSTSRGPPPEADVDTGWLPLGGQADPSATYAPLVTLGLDIGQLRTKVDRDP
jgi:hypothetical protein